MAIVKPVLTILQKTVTRWSRNDGNLLAASMAYYAAFAFFPLMLVLIDALGLALRLSENAQNAKQQLLDLLSQTTAPSFAEEVDSILTVVQTRAPINSLIGPIILMLGAIGIFSQLESAFDRLWHAVTPHKRGVRAAIRNALWNRLKAFLTLLGLGVVVILAFLSEIVLTAVQTWAEAENLHWSASLWAWIQTGFSVLLSAFVLSAVYGLIPRVQVRWKHAAIGGIAVAIIWQVGSQIVSRFIVGGHYTAYGVVGSFIAVMLWVYCASILLFLGAQLVQVLGHPEEDVLVELPARPVQPMSGAADPPGRAVAAGPEASARRGKTE
ncbi:MAG: YihY/virulence factor BrkB family protein [Pirellulales bacterium]